jgi:diguanylate cyclase (GGDEF)-like protein/PAS domain S-box-containing protein
MSRLSGLGHRIVAAIPVGVKLAPQEWARRHRWIVALVWFHVPVIVVFGFARGNGLAHNAAEGIPVAACAVLAGQVEWNQRVRSVLAGLGLMLSSAVLVHLSGGLTVMHFHFFVMLGVISLYQDWLPFLLAIGFVAAHHGIVGYFRPHDVFDNPAAWRSPVKWAALHAFFVLAMSVVSVMSWRIVEDDHLRSRAALEANERRFRSLIEHSSDVVTVLDATGSIVYDSPSSLRVLGYPAGDRIGTAGLEYVHPEDVGAARAVLESIGGSAVGGNVTNLEVRVRHHDGSYRWVEASVTQLEDEVDGGGVVANFRDITDRKMLENQLRHQAFHDPLTGLANRALLLNRIEHALDSARRQPDARLALLYLDVDDFKTVNDGLGHEAGDRILREVAHRIAATLRPGDTASRLGGDEFAILLEELPTPATAYEIGERLLEALQAPFELDDHPGVSVFASLGIVASSGSDDAATLLRNADLAMYRAKAQGKGRYEVYETSMHAAVVDRMALKADLRRAVDAGEFEPHYQPIVDLQSGRAIGVEALIRWHHPTRGLMPPVLFIPLAEETGIIVPMGSQMLRRACADLVRWQDELGDLAPKSVSVNLSVRQIQDPGLIEDVRFALESAGLRPEALILEITESILLNDAEAAAQTLASLRSLGVRVALDDFGTGYSSLSYLDRFPVDILKIDRTFVEALSDGADGHSPLVAAIVNLGGMLGLSVTAEGIEDATQLRHLRDMGCGQGQGYYFAKPLPAGELTHHLRGGFAGDPASSGLLVPAR